jgi:hypothetical protein
VAWLIRQEMLPHRDHGSARGIQTGFSARAGLFFISHFDTVHQASFHTGQSLRHAQANAGRSSWGEIETEITERQGVRACSQAKQQVGQVVVAKW